MLATYIQRGESLDCIPSEDISSGDIVIRKTLVGIAKLDIDANTLGALAVTGVYDVAKGEVAFEAGDKVYWDATDKVANATATDVYLGKATAAAIAADMTVRILLNAPGA